MEFTRSFFEARLLHILTAASHRETESAELPLQNRPLAFRFSRRRRRSASSTPASLSDRISALARVVDRLVLDCAHSQGETPNHLPMVTVAEIEGLVLWAPASDWRLVCFYLMSGGFDPGLVQFLRGNIRHESVFLDIGALLGSYTILAALLVGSAGLVCSFEPEPEAYRWLLLNLERSGLGEGGRVRPQQVRVGDRCGTSTSGPTVSALALDDLFSPGTRVDVIRIAGSSVVSDVLRGMRRICRENPRCLVIVDYCAALQPVGSNLASLIEEIRRMGFSTQRIDSQTGALASLNQADTAGVFSINLLLEQLGGTSWSK